MSASGSLFTATMTLLDVIPARCWIAPEIPSAMYRSGVTVRPVWPTCSSFGRHPASVTARDAPRAAPRMPASSSTCFQFSGPRRPRPPETTTRASASGIRPLAAALGSNRWNASFSALASAVTLSTTGSAAPLLSVNAPGRTETTAGSVARTVARTLPAYIVRVIVAALDLFPDVDAVEAPGGTRISGRELRDRRDVRPAEGLRERETDEPLVVVGGLPPAEDEIGLRLLDHLRERARHGGSLQRLRTLSAHEDRLVAAHRERLAERITPARRAERHDRDGRRGIRVLALERELDRVLVVRRDRPRDLARVDGPAVGRDLHAHGRVRGLLHAHQDLHLSRTSHMVPRARRPRRRRGRAPGRERGSITSERSDVLGRAP